ncbi:MAG: J domain-containing protein [Actinomycetota bacterium]
MAAARPQTHYELLGVDPAASIDDVRKAYRRRARQAHPDVALATEVLPFTMVQLNEAWSVLSDPDERRLYDERLRELVRPVQPTAAPQPPPKAARTRRAAWAAGMQGSIAKMSRLAGRSATQSLLIRQPRAPRYEYERLVAALVQGLCEDTESRVRAARAAGAAPLDLPVGATLVGIRTLADRLRRDASVAVTPDVLMTAELLDRMWDILAHELPVQLTTALGGNPRVAKAVATFDALRPRVS